MYAKELENNISSISKETIQRNNNNSLETVEICYCSPEEAKFVTYLVENEIQKGNIEQKILYFHFIDKIMRMEINNKRTTINYIKSFGLRMKSIVQNFLVANNIEDLDKVFNIITKWEQELIYHPHFLIKLRQILFPKYDILQMHYKQKKIQEKKDQQIFDKSLKIVQSNKISVQYYNLLSATPYLESKFKEFNEKKDKCQKMRDIKQTIEDGEHCRQTCIQFICQLQMLYFHLANQGEQLSIDDNLNKKKEYYKLIRKKLKL